MRWMVVAFVAGLFTGPLPEAAGQTSGGTPDVDLELVLAVDVSRSMDMGEQRLQRQGYIDAFRHPQVVDAIRSGPLGRIAVTYFEWAGVNLQWHVVPWRVVANAPDAEAIAAALEAAPIHNASRTSISSALTYAGAQFGRAHTGYRRAVDVSGDGANNAGPPVDLARDRLVAEGITINGLPMMLRPGGPMTTPYLDAYYEDCVIGGPGAFMVTIRDVGEFAAAIRRKLILEVSGLLPEVVPAQAQSGPRGDCQVGERQWRNFIFDP